MNYIPKLIPHLLAFVVFTLAIFVFLNSGFMIGYLIVNWRKLSKRVVQFTTGVKILRCRLLAYIGQKLTAGRHFINEFVAKLKDEYSHAREMNIERCLNSLFLVRIGLSSSGSGLNKIRQDLEDLFGDLERLRSDPADDQLYDLVETKMNDLKFQFGRSMLIDGTSLDPMIRQTVEQELAAANCAIKGEFSTAERRI